MRYAKAFVGAAVAGLASLKAVLDGGVSVAEAVEVASVTLVAFSAVWAVPNRP